MMRRRFDRCRSAAIKLAKAEPYEVDDPLAEKEERKRRRAYEKSRFGDKRKTKKAGSCGGDTAYPDCYCPGSCDAFEGFEGCDLPAVDCSP